MIVMAIRHAMSEAILSVTERTGSLALPDHRDGKIAS
jgi:hypothetical protein